MLSGQAVGFQEDIYPRFDLRVVVFWQWSRLSRLPPLAMIYPASDSPAHRKLLQVISRELLSFCYITAVNITLQQQTW